MPAWTHCVLSVALATTSCASESSSFAPSETKKPSNARKVARPFASSTGDASASSGGAPAVGAAGATGAPVVTGESGVDAGPDTGQEPIAPLDCVPHRPVLTPAVTNARDLGGTPLADDAAVACGAVYRGQPLRLTEEGCADAAKLGVRTVLDLRIESERLSTPDAACVDAKLVFAPLPIPYGLAAADYLNVLHETSSIAVAFHTFGDPDAYPIYLHCTLGRDRTGIVSALLLLTLGASRETVMNEYLLSEPNVGASPDSLDAVLDEVEQRGGVESVLRDAGITDSELAVMRAASIATTLD
jgi:protein-tyrosine phosphatase